MSLASAVMQGKRYSDRPTDAWCEVYDLVTQKTPKTLIDKGFSMRQQR